MRLILFIFFLGIWHLVSSQSESLVSLKKIELSTKNLSEYNLRLSDKTAFYLSDKPLFKVTQVKDTKGNNLNRIYYCTRRDEKFGNPKVLDIHFENHIGSFDVNSAGDFIVFTGRQTANAKTFGLFKTEKVKGKWSDPELIFKGMEQFHFTDPFLTNSGDSLYFSSDMTGGFGGLDLYCAIKTVGEWTQSKNLGGEVNTPENERFPCFRKNVLYFSSKRKQGLGGLDIYTNSFEGGKFTTSVMLNSIVNSSADDFSVSFDRDNLIFTSNRDGSDDLFTLVSIFPKFDCFPEIALERCFEFSDEYSDLIDSSAYIYKWSMGDGTAYEGVFIDHCYLDSGTYLVELKIFDMETNNLVSNQASFELNIEDPEQLAIIVPEIRNTNINLEFSVGKDILADSSKCFWDFGDGEFAYGETVIHKYFQSGSYELRVGRIAYFLGEEKRVCTSKIITIL